MGLNMDKKGKIGLKKIMSASWKSQVRYLGIKIMSSMKTDILTGLNLNQIIKGA